MLVLSTERSQILAGRLSAILGQPLGDIKWQKFPDGEIYMRASKIEKEVVIVASIVTSDDLVELLLLNDVYREAKTTLVIPYMGYARQDKQFNPGEALSARAIAQAVSLGTWRVITVNIHEDSVLDYFSVPAESVSLAKSAGEYIKTLQLTNPLILGPDEGAAVLSSDIAAIGNWESDHLQKVRISGDEVRIEPKTIPVKKRDVIIVDDILSTGGTQATAASMLYEQGAASIRTISVHGIFASGAYTRLLAAGIKEVICSDTIEQACSGFSAAREIAAAIKRDN